MKFKFDLPSLEAYEADICLGERERIIALLETEAIDLHEDSWIPLVRVIALINGETE